MKYLDEIVWGPITPKWAGAYEMGAARYRGGNRENGYDRIIDIGCAEGYYAVGLALLGRSVEVRAFDCDPFVRMQVRRLARLNGMSNRIHVAGRCTVRRLNRLIRTKTLIVCAAEGYEAILVDPVKVPALKNADLLIEIHEENASSGASTMEELITTRLVHSHRIERRLSSGRERWMEENRSVLESKVSRDRMMKSLDEGRSAAQVYLWAKTTSEF